MQWSEFSVHTTQEAVEPICNILHEAGASGVVIEDPQDLMKDWGDKFGEIYQLSPDDYPKEGVIVKAYFLVNESFSTTVDEIKELITNLTTYDIDIGSNKVSLHEVQEEEWAHAWKKYYKPVRISDSITIKPTWESYEKTHEGEKIIELDPGMAFGTGTHPTTVLCIQSLEKVLQEGDRVIDVGTGSGVLSIAAAMLGASEILALDLDEVAVNSAKQNVSINKVDHLVTVSQNNLLDDIEGCYDLVVANILAEVIIRFVQNAARVLKQDGLFITSGIINSKKTLVKESLLQYGFEIVEELQMEDWVAIIAKKS
jgi:ribosomal protein L11 methyltransferase